MEITIILNNLKNQNINFMALYFKHILNLLLIEVIIGVLASPNEAYMTALLSYLGKVGHCI